MTEVKELLQMRNISKKFAGIQALHDASFTLRAGEIHALMGANGAGKSTLIKILCGVHIADQGTIVFEGKEISIKNPFEAQRCGIGYVPQEIAVQPYMSVAENIFLGQQPLNARKIIDFPQMERDALSLLKDLGISIDPKTLGRDLSIAEKQLITIAKAISLKSKILIFDEATSALTLSDTKNLFRIIKRLKEKGMGVIYVTHRMEEIFELCDTVSVFRDGSFIQESAMNEMDLKCLINLMIGREVLSELRQDRSMNNEILLKIENFSKVGLLDNVGLELRKGEILGIAGLVGAGRTELVRAIFGDLTIDSGTMEISGRSLKIENCRDAIDAGIALVPEDRKEQGLILSFSLRKNISMPILDKLRTFAFLSRKKEAAVATEFLARLNIKSKSIEQRVSTLSGGNQQRVVLGKWLATKPKILLVDEPTRGVDVAAKADIHKILMELAREGIGIIVISSELGELLQVTERIIVLHRGRIVGSVFSNETTTQELMEMATGESPEIGLGSNK